MKNLFRHLVDSRLVTPQDLEEAEARSLIYGGDVGLNLIELGIISESDLLKAKAFVVDMVPAKIASLRLSPTWSEKLSVLGVKAVAGRLEGGRAQVTVSEPIEEADRRAIEKLLHAPVDYQLTHVWRMDEALFGLFAQKIPSRHLDLLDDLGQEPPRIETEIEGESAARLRAALDSKNWATTEVPSAETIHALNSAPPIEAPVPLEAQTAEPPLIQTAEAPLVITTPHTQTAPPPIDYGSITSSLGPTSDEADEEAKVPPAITVNSQHLSEQLGLVREGLLTANNREQVLRHLMKGALLYFEYAAAFSVSGKEARGLRAEGPGRPSAELPQIRIPLDLDSPLSRAVSARRYQLSRLRASGLEGGISQDLRRPSGRKICLFPFSVRGRVVLLLWGDMGKADVSAQAIPEILDLVPLAESALERALVERKRASIMPMSAAELFQGTIPHGLAMQEDEARSQGRSSQEAPISLTSAPELSLPSEFLARRDARSREPGEASDPKQHVEAEGEASLPQAGKARPLRAAKSPEAAFPKAKPTDSEGSLPSPLSPSKGRVQTHKMMAAPPAQKAAPEPAPSGNFEEVRNPEQPLDEDPRFPSDAPRTWKGFPGTQTAPPAPPLPRLYGPASALPPVQPRRMVAIASPRPKGAAGGSSIPPSEAPSPSSEFYQADEREISPFDDASVSAFADQKEEHAKKASEPAPLPPLEAPAPELTFAPQQKPKALLSRRPLHSEPPEDAWGHPAPVAKSTARSGLNKGIGSAELSSMDPDQTVGALVDRYLGGDERALHSLVASGDAAAAVLMNRFPGPLIDPSRNDLSASMAGPLLKALVRIGPASLPFVTIRTADENPDIRRWAALVLGELPGKDSARALAPRILDTHVEVRQAALLSARALARDPVSRRTLRAQLEETIMDARAGTEMRTLAIHALADMREQEAIPCLLVILGEKDRSMARSAQWALCVLTRHDFGPNVTAWRGFWQEHRDEPRHEWLLAALTEDDPDLKKAAFEELRALLPGELDPALLTDSELLRSQFDKLRVRLAEAALEAGRRTT